MEIRRGVTPFRFIEHVEGLAIPAWTAGVSFGAELSRVRRSLFCGFLKVACLVREVASGFQLVGILPSQRGWVQRRCVRDAAGENWGMMASYRDGFIASNLRIAHKHTSGAKGLKRISTMKRAREEEDEQVKVLREQLASVEELLALDPENSDVLPVIISSPVSL
jgi:hypothetical protein